MAPSGKRVSRSGPDGYSDTEEMADNSFEVVDNPSQDQLAELVDLRIVEGRDDEFEAPDFAPSGVYQWILREELGQEAVVAGPFDLNDEDSFDDGLVELLRQHPWDDTPVYRGLILDPVEGPRVEDLGEYLVPLLEEAWSGIEDDEDWGNDALGG
jgi:hypothetical protein